MSSTALPVVLPIPIYDPIARARNRQKYRGAEKDPLEGTVTELWSGFFSQQNLAIQAAPTRIAVVPVTNQSASIGLTDITGGSIVGGLYALSYYARITVPASVSSSLTIALDWRDGGVTLTFTGAAMTGNTTSTYQSGGLPLIKVDSLSPVRYSATRVSVGTPMSFDLVVQLDRVGS
jgi:hypothetical protein